MKAMSTSSCSKDTTTVTVLLVFQLIVRNFLNLIIETSGGKPLFYILFAIGGPLMCQVKEVGGRIILVINVMYERSNRTFEWIAST